MKGKTKQEFKDAWLEEINILGILYCSLPQNEFKAMTATIEELKRLVDCAAVNVYNDDGTKREKTLSQLARSK